LEPYADIASEDNSKLKSDNNQRGPMLSYKMTDDVIKWKRETATETTQADASNSIIGDEWCKFDFDLANKTNARLICNIADALQVCHSRYEKLKKMNNTQKVEHDLIQLGMLSVMQMHCNDTETSNDHSWKDTFRMMRDRHFED
jgi:hypothetical protein